MGILLAAIIITLKLLSIITLSWTIAILLSVILLFVEYRYSEYKNNINTGIKCVEEKLFLETNTQVNFLTAKTEELTNRVEELESELENISNND